MLGYSNNLKIYLVIADKSVMCPDCPRLMSRQEISL